MNAMVFANRDGRVKELKKWVGSVFAEKRPYCLVSVSSNATPQDEAFEDAPRELTRGLIVFEDAKVEIGSVDAWRAWAIERGAWELHVAFLRFFTGSDEERFKKIMRLCRGWEKPVPDPEQAAVSKEEYVTISADPNHGKSERDIATLLTMTLGSMGDLLTRVELLARSFRGVLPKSRGVLDEASIVSYLSDIGSRLKGTKGPNPKSPFLNMDESADGIPKLLLRGHSGVGKSLIAAYIHRRTGWDRPPLRIPIPEYLRKEDMFEYDLFGYCKGAYTGGKEEGSCGLLLANVGRVVFLDEIGEANAYLQAKLLAFLDDYKVRPRGWAGDPFFCPVLVVAATNRDLDAMVRKQEFREDLLARFTDRYKIPNLNERIDDLPFILDCLLQRSAMNHGGKIKEIGRQAFESLKRKDFSKGNFRQLENLFRKACERAGRDGRNYIVQADVESADSDWAS